MLSRANRIRIFFKATPVAAIVSFIMGIISVVLFIAVAVMSIIGKGNAGIIIGIMGVAAMFLNVVGFAMATASTKSEQEIEYRLPMISVVFNGFMFIIYMIFYVFGFMVNI